MASTPVDLKRLREQPPDDRIGSLSTREPVHKIEAWREDYNRKRPHSSLDYQTLEEFARGLHPFAVEPSIAPDARPVKATLAGEPRPALTLPPGSLKLCSALTTSSSRFFGSPPAARPCPVINPPPASSAACSPAPDPCSRRASLTFSPRYFDLPAPTPVLSVLIPSASMHKSPTLRSAGSSSPRNSSLSSSFCGVPRGALDRDICLG